MQIPTPDKPQTSRFRIAIRILACLLAVLMLLSTVSLNLSRIVSPKKSKVVSADAAQGAFNAIAADDTYLNASALERVQMLWSKIGSKQQTAEDCVQVASMYIGRGDYTEAELLYARSIELTDPADREALAERQLKHGAIQVLCGELDAAEKSFLSALSNNSGMLMAYTLLTQVYVEKKDYEKAAEQLNTYLKYVPTDDKNRLLLGNLYEYCNKPALAYAQYLMLYERTEDPARHTDIARAGLQCGRYEKAAEHLTLYLEDNEDADGSIHFLRGMAYLWSESFQEAEKDLLEALSLGYSDEAGCYDSLSTCAYVQNRYQDAVTYGRQAESRWTEPDAACLQRIGLSLMQQERYDEALDYIKRSIATDPTVVESYYFLATLYFVKADYDGAIEAYTRAIEGDYLVQECCYNRAICYLQKEEPEPAVADLVACLTNGEDETIKLEALAILQQLGVVEVAPKQ